MNLEIAGQVLKVGANMVWLNLCLKPLTSILADKNELGGWDLCYILSERDLEGLQGDLAT